MKTGAISKRSVAGFQLSLLILSLFSFSYMIYSVDLVVGGYWLDKPGGTWIESGDTVARAITPTNLPDLSKKILPPSTNLLSSGTAQITTEALTLPVPGGGFTTIPANTHLTVLPGDAGATFATANGGTGHLTATQVTAAQNAGQIGNPLSTNQASSWFGLDAGTKMDALVSGLQWATYAYMAGQMLGSMLGFSDDNTQALSASLAAGFGSYKLLQTWGTTADGLLGMSPGVIGFGIGAAVFLATYKQIETTTVTFGCMPWQAPNGGNNCELCNDADLPCSEYRCKSLGQSCEIVNAGTKEEKCVYVNPHDVNPPIINPNPAKLSAGHQYKNVKSSPPGPGFDIVNLGSRDGCLKAFTPLEFGITLDEPAQCKIDFNHTTSFDEMVNYVGGNNLYLYNHSEIFSLPGASELSGSGIVLENGKNLNFFLRCKDKNGNENSAEYSVNFCIDPSPDRTVPKIEATSIINGGCVADGTDKVEVTFYVNEPSECRWSFQDQDYDLMSNEMSCSNSITQINGAQLFGCSGELTGIPRDGTNYYIRCEDQPGKNESERNKNKESFEFRLKGSTGLVMTKLMPNGTVFGGVDPAPVELYVETMLGCNDGRAVCEWSSDDSDYIPFFDTNNEDGIHTQRLDLSDGNHDYYVKCVDAGGNIVKDVASFEVDIDTSAPTVARIYEESGMLKIITTRDSECSYSLENCEFSFSEGIEMPYGNTSIHVVEWSNDNTYYIKCRDEFLNEGAGCSAVIKPTENFL